MLHDAWRSLELETLLQIAETWRNLNWTYFDERLIPPSFHLFDGADYGRWDPNARTIGLSRRLVFEERWSSVVEVLKHEMAHQFADEELRATDETAHGAAFRSAAERIGIDPRASGPLDPVRVDGEDERIIQKVARLLSLATSPNQHEAEAAAIAARRLMAKHNLERPEGPRRYTHKVLGRPMRRLDESARVLGRILHEHFFVEAVWIREYLPHERAYGTALEIFGTPSNVAIAEYVHDYLSHAAAELWEERRATKQKGDKRTFLAGVMHGFLAKLSAESVQSSERALVRVKDAELEHQFKRRHPRLERMRRQGQRRDATFHEGKEKGRRIVLKKGVEGTTLRRGRLLGPGE